MNRSVSVGVVVLVVVSLVAVGPGLGTAFATAGDSGTATASQSSLAAADGAPAVESVGSTEEFDQTTYRITVHENGSATWTFEHRVQFDENDTEDDVEAFETFADEFEAEETELNERLVNQSRALTEAEVDREMDATNFRHSAGVEDPTLSGEYGYVELSFLWTGFAAVDDDTVAVGDVFEDIYLYPDQALIIEAGEGLSFDRVEPEEDAQYTGGSVETADQVEWHGTQSFIDGQPSAVLERSDAGGSLLPAIASNNAWLLGIGLLILAVAGVAIWYRREVDGDAIGTVLPTGSDDETSASTAADATAPDEPESSSDAESLPEEELLTDEDRVVKLIRENGGRMKQVNIVEETGWSKSKVSMLLSEMEEEGTISKLRVGRENIISLEGYEPEATKSPFEE